MDETISKILTIIIFYIVFYGTIIIYKKHKLKEIERKIQDGKQTNIQKSK